MWPLPLNDNTTGPSRQILVAAAWAQPPRTAAAMHNAAAAT